jgi:hypothetical protein
MTAAVVERVGHTSVEDDAALCVTALGADLTAYVSGAATAGEFASWFAAGHQPPWPARRRLATAAEVVGVFAAANQSALAAAWLREVDPAGFMPARVLRLSEGDEAGVKALIESAMSWAPTTA